MSSMDAAQRRNLVAQARLVLMHGPLKAFTATDLQTIGSAVQIFDNNSFFGAPADLVRHAIIPHFVAEMSQEDQKRPGLA